MPQNNTAVVDDEYGLEKAPAGSGVTDQEYGLEPVDKNEEPHDDTREKLPGATARGKAAAEARNMKLTPLEERTPGEGISLKGTGGAIWDKLKSMVPSTPEGVTTVNPFNPDFWTTANLIGHPKFDPANSGIAQIGREASAEYKRARAAGVNPVAAGYSAAISGAGPLVGVSDLEQQELAKQGEGGKILGESVAAAAPAVLPLGMEGVGKIPAIKNIGPRVALAARTEEGALKPSVQTGSRLAGAALGHFAGMPGAGELGGAYLGPKIADAIIPNLPHDIPTKMPIGAPLPAADEFYENRAEDLAKRGKEQAAIDKAAVRETKANPPFETPGSAPATLPSAEDFYEHRGMDLLRRGAQEEAVARKQAAAEGKIPKIISPTEGEPRVSPESEGRGATWTNEAVLEEAAKGNRTGITQAIRRKLQMPENVRYVMGDPDYPRAVLNPREVTLFSPEGIPIRNKANAQAEAQPGSIPTIARTPRGSIPNIGEAPQGAPLPFPGPLPETSTPIAAKPSAEAPIAAQPPAPEPVAAAGEAKTPETAAPVRDKNETNAIRAELSEYTQKAKKWGDKIATARPSSWRAQRDWMENLEAADKRVAELRDALETGKPIKLGPRAATKEELTATYRELGTEDKAKVDELLKEYSILDAQGKASFASEHGLGNSMWKGLPLKEKLAKRVTGANSPDEAMNFIRSLGENPDAEPAEPEVQQASEPTKPLIPNIGKGQTGIIPGMEQDVAKQNAGAAKVTGERLTGEANTPKDISAAAGRMETLSPLFRGTEASPQKEIFGKIPTTKQMVPPPIEEALKDTNWEYEGKNNLGLYTVKEPGTNIRLSLFERDLNPDFIRRKIAEKERQYGAPKKKGKPEGSEEVPF